MTEHVAMTRHEMRECAFLILFEMTFRADEPTEEFYAMAEEVQELTVTDGVRAMVEGVTVHKEALDDVIAAYSKKRALNRVPRINLTILRLALFEILHDDTMPTNVAIAEAIALSEAYAYPEDTAFINGVLGAYVRENHLEDAVEASEPDGETANV